ncbi:MAG: hypothetical protein ACTSQE_01340 [Candidatus Heimdallarchaeaceae archaeon]
MCAKTVKDILNQREEYKKEVLEVLRSNPRPKVAYHYNCCDGIVSCSITKKIFEGKDLSYLPIDYSLLVNKKVRREFVKSNWYAIVDLEPFSENELKLYSDHHISAVGKYINAQKIFFEAGAPSTSFLLNKAFSSSLPDYIKELAEMTEITDTASYTIPPPIELEESVEDFNYDTKIWFLEDACKTTFTLRAHDVITDILSTKGWIGLWEKDKKEVMSIHERIRNLRFGRKKAYEVSQQLEISDFVILIDRPMHYNITFIAHELMHRGAKGVAYLTEYPDATRISLRLSKQLDDEQIEKYRVDLLAKEMNGGGHKPASGAQTKNIRDAIEKITAWTTKMNLENTIVDLRKNHSQ